MVNSCQQCSECHEGLEQFCLNGFTGAYNGDRMVGGDVKCRFVIDMASLRAA